MSIEELIKAGEELGFTHVAPMDCSTIKLMPEVRDMCATNSCHKYGSNWACPPGCGTIEECEERIRGYRTGLIVQTVGELEDNMDVETMMETEQNQKQSFFKFREYLQEYYPKMLALGAGTCTLCKECTYPDEPCRFPEKAVSSMEAYGMLVNQICTDNQVDYYYGDCTIAYTSCYLLE